MKHQSLKRIMALISFGFLLGAVSCSSMKLGSSRYLTLNAADRFRVGIDHGADIRATFGEPDFKLPDESLKVDSWLYCERAKCSQPTLVFQVDPSTDLVRSVSISVREREPEQDLAVAQTRYLGVTLKRERYLVDFGDHFYTTESYVDYDRGIMFGTNAESHKVTAITRSDLLSRSREVSDAKDGFPKISRIDDRETASQD